MNNADDTSLEVSANTGGAEPILGASNEENQTLMSINENTELLSESNSGTGSFAELEQYINDNKGYEKTVTLNKDYSFNNETDSDYNVLLMVKAIQLMQKTADIFSILSVQISLLKILILKIPTIVQ